MLLALCLLVAGPARAACDVPVPAFTMLTETSLSWQAVPGGDGTVDVVKGSLAGLLGSGGDFTGSVLACVANDVTLLTATDADPAVTGQGFYYLARGAQCGLPGTYDDGTASQSASRDAPIDASPAPCP